MNQDQQKTYIIFLNDESGSMHSLRAAATKDYNANIDGVKTSASKHEQDTIVSMFGFGNSEVRRYVVNSNPHVLKPIASWTASGGTPGRKALKAAIELFKTMPDFNSPNVAFAVFCTTDGDFDRSSRLREPSDVTTEDLSREMNELMGSGRWTFVFRVPKGGRAALREYNIPAGNIQEWETTEAGMAKSTAQTTQAFDTFFATRATGQKSSTVFYANAQAVDTSKLVDVTDKVSLYVVPQPSNPGDKIEIRDFILKHRMQYLKGSAFYQLTKTEARVQPSKMIAVRDRTTGKIYAGAEARQMLGLSTVNNIRLHPGDHGNFDLFVQSESVNRHLVPGTGVVYWEAIGKPFTEADLAYLKPKTDANGVVQLPAVAPTNKPTPSPLKPQGKIAASLPIPKATPTWPVNMAMAPQVPTVGGSKPTAQPAVNGRVRYHAPTVDALFYSTRDIAREVAVSMPGKKQYDAGPTAPYGRRFFVDAA